MQLTDGEDLHTTVLNAPIGIAILNADTLVAEIVNEKFLEVAGKPYAAIHGQFYWDAFAEARPYYETALAGVVTSGQAYYANEVELMLIRQGIEEIIFVTFVYAPVKDKTGKVKKIAVWVLENTKQVTERQKVEAAREAFQQERDRLKNFFMQAPAGICILDGPELKYELVNPAYQQLLPGRNLLNRPIFEALPELVGTPLEEVILNVYRSGEPYEVNQLLIPVAAYEGGPTLDRYFTFNYIARRDGNDQTDGVLAFVFEVTGLMQVQQDQLAMNEELAATNEESQAVNEELVAANEALLIVQQELQTLTEEKQSAIDRLRVNEQNIRNMVRQAPVGMCIVEGDPLFVMEVNDSFLEIIGKSREEIKLKPYWEVVPEAAAFYEPITDSVMATGLTYHANEHEIMLIRKGIEELVNVDFVYEPMKDPGGNTYAIMIVAIDVTEKVTHRKKVERAEESLRMAIDAAGLGSYYINVIDRQFYPSQKLKEFFGFGPDEEMPYEAAIDQIHPDYRAAVAGAVEAAIINGTRFDMEYPIVAHNDARIRWVRAIGTVQQDDNGSKRYFTGVLHEITEQKQDEIRKNDFIGMVSHELKTPLTSLTAIVQVANKKLMNSEDKFLAGAMDKAGTQVKRMTRMINGFLNISRLESGKILIDKQTFDLEDLIEEMIRETEMTVNSHEIRFKPCAPVLISADHDKIGSVITNLISNAVKYSPKGKLIEVTCEVQGDIAQVSVCDEGMGIKASDKENLFERYYRVENPHTQHISGFGIGLYLSAEIIHRHDGRIWLESESGVGSTFYFSLPLIGHQEEK
jgi:two-component system sensor histidine kinase VicK